jgi:FkbM family methyltransferase
MHRIETAEGPFWVYDASYVGSILATGQWWDEHIRGALDGAAVARPNTWAIDLGANLGWFTCYLAKLFSHVLAVEAHPQLFDVLEKNVALHELSNVHLLWCAAFDSETTLVPASKQALGWEVPTDLDRDANVDSIAFVPLDSPGAGTGQTVPAMPLDDYLLEHHPDAKVGVIKSDVQGADLRALWGLRKTIERDRPHIIFEFEGGLSRILGDGLEDYLEFFRELDYVEPLFLHSFDYLAVPKG